MYTFENILNNNNNSFINKIIIITLVLNIILCQILIKAGHNNVLDI